VSYQLLLWVHILSATLLFGTGLGTAFHGWMAQRSGDLRVIVMVSRNVVLADWLFTAPAVVVQPITGAWMARAAGIPFTTGWLALTIGIYVLVGACWLPVVWLQIQMHRMADTALRSGQPMPALYRTYARWWFALGWPAFLGVIAIFYLMVFKPDL
jgi:uncharacterized membrane protein